MTIIAKPIAASAAATVKVNSVNICPTNVVRKNENEIKLMLTARRLVQLTLK